MPKKVSFDYLKLQLNNHSTDLHCIWRGLDEKLRQCLDTWRISISERCQQNENGLCLHSHAHACKESGDIGAELGSASSAK